MTKGLIASTAEEIFKSPQGSHLDVIYRTSDNAFWFSKKEALNASGKLEDKTIVPHYRDPRVREMAERYTGLKIMIHATDYLKLMKVYKSMPMYDSYVTNAEENNIQPVTEELFEFIRSKVYLSNKPKSVGIRDHIYMFGRGIVPAVFIIRYPQGIVWTVGNDLVLTCPTHTELSHGSFYDLFSSFLTNPNPVQQAEPVATA